MTREQTFDKLYSLRLHGLASSLEGQLTNPEMDAPQFRRAPGPASGPPQDVAFHTGLND